MDKVLVDTSAWIEFFRGKEPYRSAVERLIDEDRVCCAGLVFGELLQRAKSTRELGTLKYFLHVFEFLEDSPSIWERAGELACSLRRKGRTVGLSDCYLAAAAVARGASILTLDRHFRALKKEIPLRLTIPEA
ncbi:MAG: hypothetical protein Kow00128_16650 [Deltaproteobacteria bacterium]